MRDAAGKYIDWRGNILIGREGDTIGGKPIGLSVTPLLHINQWAALFYHRKMNTITTFLDYILDLELRNLLRGQFETIKLYKDLFYFADNTRLKFLLKNWTWLKLYDQQEIMNLVNSQLGRNTLSPPVAYSAPKMGELTPSYLEAYGETVYDLIERSDWKSIFFDLDKAHQHEIRERLQGNWGRSKNYVDLCDFQTRMEMVILAEKYNLPWKEITYWIWFQGASAHKPHQTPREFVMYWRAREIGTDPFDFSDGEQNEK